jgi:hypothetical protein
MVASRTTELVKDGCCRHCGSKLGLLQRLSKQEFCSAEHRKAYLREQEQLALECLQQSVESPKPAACLDDIDLEAGPPDHLLGQVFREAVPAGNQEASQPLATAATETEADPPEAGMIGYRCCGELAPAGADIASLTIAAAPEFPRTAPALFTGGMKVAGLLDTVRPVAPFPERRKESEIEPLSLTPEAAAKPAFNGAPAIDWEDIQEAERRHEERDRGPIPASVVALAGPALLAVHREVKSQTPATTPWVSDLRFPKAWAGAGRDDSGQIPPPAVSLVTIPAPVPVVLTGGFRRPPAGASPAQPATCFPAALIPLAPGRQEEETGAPELGELAPMPAFQPSRRESGICLDSAGPWDVAMQAIVPQPAPRRWYAAGLLLAAQCDASGPLIHPRPLPAMVRFELPAFSEPAGVQMTCLNGRPQPRVAGPPLPRKRMRASLPMRDPGANPLLDPLGCPFGAQEEAWQPEL